MWGNLIARRVWKAIKQKIRNAQREYELGIIRFDKQREEEIKAAEERCEKQKIDLADQLVKQIIG